MGILGSVVRELCVAKALPLWEGQVGAEIAAREVSQPSVPAILASLCVEPAETRPSLLGQGILGDRRGAGGGRGAPLEPRVGGGLASCVEFEGLPRALCYPSPP